MIPPEYLPEFEETLRYLSSDQALKAIDADPYWPKWASPWWRMLLLHEMGETAQIPELTVERYVESVKRYPLKIFPIHPSDVPAGVDPYRGTMCHCYVGNLYQVLATFGVDVDQELPWARPWMLRYQMNDGGMSCDNDAYLVKDETPSSMVGMISSFEAVLKHTPRAWTAEEKAFLDRGAEFLISRELRLGSTTKHNASELESAKEWMKLCFPRFYFYDVLRGLSALTLWGEKTGGVVPHEAISVVVAELERKFPDGQVRVERRAYEGAGSLNQSASGEWARGKAELFPLLVRVSEVGLVSPLLKGVWSK